MYCWRLAVPVHLLLQGLVLVDVVLVEPVVSFSGSVPQANGK